MKENLFDAIPADTTEEFFQPILERSDFKLERIVSHAHRTPEGEWYDQAWDEWVMVIKGSAGLLIEGEPEIQLDPGDYILLPAHKRHRVEWTTDQGETIWLAIHFKHSD